MPIKTAPAKPKIIIQFTSFQIDKFVVQTDLIHYHYHYQKTKSYSKELKKFMELLKTILQFGFYGLLTYIGWLILDFAITHRKRKGSK